ncbi:MAG: hypothetical protein J3Q66DRAFT_328024 [Benniella sp.]|nr:MAG: hypothetical protein J3Q66DRAFT_328024 [Benniella sp.]
MSGFLTLAKRAFAAPRLATLAGANTMAVRGYAAKKIFIASIPWKTTDDEMKDFLSQYGNLTDHYFPKDPMGHTSGYGFVEVDEEEADAFIQEIDGREFKGRALKAQPANARPERRERSRDRDGNRRDFRDRRGGNNDNMYRRGDDRQSFRRGGDREERGSDDRPFRRDSERSSRGGYDRE